MQAFLAYVVRIATKKGARIRVANDPKAAPRRQDRAEKSRRDILRASRRAFARFGYDGANIRDIAEEVGVTHTLIRYHFGNKLDLWKTVVDDMFNRLSSEMSNKRIGAPDLSTRDGMRMWLRQYVRYCASHPEHVRIMIHESMWQTERLDYMVAHIQESHARLIPGVRKLMDDDVVPKVWLVSYFYILSTVCQMPFVLSVPIKRLYQVDMDSDEAIEAHTDAVIAFILKETATHQHGWPDLPAWVRDANDR